MTMLKDLNFSQTQGVKKLELELMSTLSLYKEKFPLAFQRIEHYQDKAFFELVGGYVMSLAFRAASSRKSVGSLMEQENKDLDELKKTYPILEVIKQKYQSSYYLKNNDLCLGSWVDSLDMLRTYPLDQAIFTDGFFKHLFNGNMMLDFGPDLKLKSLLLLQEHNLLDSTTAGKVVTSAFPLGLLASFSILKELKSLNSESVNEILDPSSDLPSLVVKLDAELDRYKNTPKIDLILNATKNIRP